MGPQCPACHQSAFPFRALLSVHPYFGEFSPAQIVCPSCGAALRVTALSRVGGPLSAVGLLAGICALCMYVGVDLTGWRLLLMGVAWIPLYSMAWTRIVRLKPWTPFHYWLPKTRVVGYTVYLLIPVAVIVFVFWLGVRFKWGM